MENESNDNLIKLDIDSLDPETRLELRAQLRKFSANMSPKFATMLSAEMQSALHLMEEDPAGPATIDISALEDREIRAELRDRFEKFSANLSPKLAQMIINSVEATADQLAAIGEAN